MHPGQYTVLNSPDQMVVKRAVEDLEYHVRVLDALGTDLTNKIILHIGGIYQDKAAALARFEENYLKLDKRIKQRLVIENDDKSYHIGDVVGLGKKLGIPVVFDHLHHRVLPAENDKNDADWIRECAETWREIDGRQKIHYSQQEPGKRPGSHSGTIRSGEFLEFIRTLEGKEIDIMLEVKDKNLSAVKCRNLISESKNIRELEQEWSRYKYAVLEHSPEGYQEIRHLLKDKKRYPAISFYQIIENSLNTENQTGHSINAALHVWGYFRKKASDQEKTYFGKILEECGAENSGIPKMKRFLWKMTEKYQESYLMSSYYFIF